MKVILSDGYYVIRKHRYDKYFYWYNAGNKWVTNRKNCSDFVDKDYAEYIMKTKCKGKQGER